MKCLFLGGVSNRTDGIGRTKKAKKETERGLTISFALSPCRIWYEIVPLYKGKGIFKGIIDLSSPTVKAEWDVGSKRRFEIYSKL